MCFIVFGREIRVRRQRESTQNYLEIFFFFFFFENEGSRGIYVEKVTLQLPTHLVGPPASLLTSAILALIPI